MGFNTLSDEALIVCNEQRFSGYQVIDGSLIVCDKHNDLGFMHDGGLSYVLSGAPYERYTLLC